VGLARWILVNGDEAAWWLLPDRDDGAQGAPRGPWHPRSARLQSPLLTRPLRLASAAPVRADELPSATVPLRVGVRQLEDAPGPAALRASASDEEWQHALDELLGAMASVAEAGGFLPVALGVVDHQVEVSLQLANPGHGHEGADRLLLVAHGWRLLGLSRGLALEVALTGGVGDVLLAGEGRS
jgi:hypothetical protein